MFVGMLIEIVPHNPAWTSDFERAAVVLREVLGPVAVAIHHIGSTSIPGLAAKDVIDIQITVLDLSSEISDSLVEAGYHFLSHLPEDHAPPGVDMPRDQLHKYVFTQRDSERRLNIHVRVEGAFNQRYAVLFRDYMRSQPAAAEAYGQIKQTLAEWFPEDIDRYYAIKDPAIDMLMAGANIWAEETGWEVPPTDA